MPIHYSDVAIHSELTVGVNDTGHDVKFFGATSGKYMLWDESADRLLFADDTLFALGTDSDMQIYHTTSGNNSYIVNYTGSLIIQNSTNDDDIIFKCDNGSGGNATYFTLDGSAANGTNTFTTWEDQAVVALGASTDLKLWHNGTNSFIKNETGIFNIVQALDDGDLVLKCDNGSGGTTAYLTLDGGDGTIEVAKSTNFAQNIDVDGTTNLDAVDIDGTVNMATTLLVSGKITADAGILLKQMTPPSAPAAGYAILYMDEETGALTAQVTDAESNTTTCVLCPGGEG
jgi:hypothetical protein